jgi:hypothetical protein
VPKVKGKGSDREAKKDDLEMMMSEHRKVVACGLWLVGNGHSNTAQF